jgi:hypothetical protein
MSPYVIPAQTPFPTRKGGGDLSIRKVNIVSEVMISKRVFPSAVNYFTQNMQ